jgi:hypothetical protein
MSSGTSGDGLHVDNDLNQLAPLFGAAVARAIAECNRQGLDAIVYEGYRSPELQAAYYARGRTVKPPLAPVTNAPTNLHSWHGYGLAVDVISRTKGWSGGDAWFAKVAAIFKANECNWGGDWTRPDPPHFQWHRCKPSPSLEAQNLIATVGAQAVWEAVGAAAVPEPVVPVTVPAPAAPRTATVTASSLNLRRAPSTSQAPLQQLPRGTTLDVLEQQGSWYKVRAGGVEGFVHGDMIAMSAPTPAAVAEFLARDPVLNSTALALATGIALPAVGPQRTAAQTWNRYGGVLAPLSRTLRIRPASAVAVLCVESGGTGMVNGRMLIRFEVHQFRRLWGAQHLDVFDSHFRFNAVKPWLGHEFNDGTGFVPFHDRQDNEWRVFDAACQMDRAAAIESISMGLPQIMGFNHEAIGYSSPAAMFDAFGASERSQILGMFDFIKGRGSSSAMVQALQNENYEAFATRYNGSGQAAGYGGRLRTHAQAFSTIVGD